MKLGRGHDIDNDSSIINLNGNETTWTNMPAAETEFKAAPANRARADLSNVDEFRFTNSQTVVGFAGATLVLQFSLDGLAWVDLVAVDAATVDMKTSAWAPLPEAAKADVFLRMVGRNADGIVDPRFGILTMETR